jgi:hypothetical protein
VALQSLRLGCSSRAFPQRGVLSELATRAEFRARRSTAIIGSAIPLCRWPFPRLCGFPSPGMLATLSSQHVLSSSFAFLQSFAQHNPACRPQPIGTSHGLWFPTALEGSEIHFSRAVPASATVRLQGLVTLWAVYALRARAGFVSHRRRSWDSPYGAFSSREVSRSFPSGRTHVPFNPSLFPPPKRWAGPTGRGFWAFTLPRVPGSLTQV